MYYEFKSVWGLCGTYELFKKGAKFLDVRPQGSISKGKIKGAIEMYVGHMTLQKIMLFVKKDEAVVVYCNGQHCSLTPEALILMKIGVTLNFTTIEMVILRGSTTVFQ